MMKDKSRICIYITILACSIVTLLFPANVVARTADAVRKEHITIQRFLREDPSLKSYFKKSYGYAVFPSIGKGGLIIGAAYGRGKVFRKGRWIGYASVKQGSVGLQIGGMAYSEIVFFRNKAAFDTFRQGRLKFAKNVSATAVVKGIGKRYRYQRGVAVFILRKGGLMAELSVGGQIFRYKPRR
ncbi:MAG: hypothetical protein BMS9Abin11_0113 [Gammaproteobacteria bacterium]|nr:MAG: hypothetical protein BMS9Abin11_0113 [Gammaproteobacteria bacterium]